MSYNSLFYRSFLFRRASRRPHLVPLLNAYRVLTGRPSDDGSYGLMPTTKLTPSFVKTATHCADPAKPGADRTIYWHQKLHGFGLMVTAGGHKSYVVQYRASGVSRRFTIKGSVPLKAALKQAKAVIGQVAKGDDPVAQKREAEVGAKAAISGTLEVVAKDYLKREGGKLRSNAERERILKKYLTQRLAPARSTASSAQRSLSCSTASPTTMGR